MKKRIAFVFAALCAVAAISAKSLPDERLSDDGSHSHTVRIGVLAANGAREELVVYNNSSSDLSDIVCTLTVGGKSHALRPINYLRTGDKEDFDGVYDDDLQEELPRAFGADGKFAAPNKSTVTFTFHFGEHNDKVALGSMYQRKGSLYFEVKDAAQTPAVQAPAAPAPAAQTAPAAGEAQKVVIDGQSYILLNGQAYKVNE